MKTKKWRHPDDQQELDRMSRATAVSFRDQVSLTTQSEKGNCDLNVLVRRFGVGPLMRPIDPNTFGFVNRDLDLQVALQTVAESTAAFDSLPASIRKRFGNDPMELLEALRDPSKRPELEEIGVLKKAPAPPITPADPAPPAPIAPVT